MNISFLSFREATKDVFVNGMLSSSKNQSHSFSSDIILELHKTQSSSKQATRAIGFLIPKGWNVQLWYRNVHMDPEVYPDSKKFNPSRWEVRRNDFNLLILEASNDMLNVQFPLNYFQGYSPRAGTFLPFGLGTRFCPGNDLAKLEISVFLHHFLLGYK